MVSLALERAPRASLPLRYLRMVPVWGVIAAGIVLYQGADVFASRWAPGTIALVHVFTLGVLGNAMLGSLLQFLPVVAGARPWAVDRLGPILPALFNIGLLGLVCGLLHWPAVIGWAGSVLAISLALFAGSALLGLRSDGQRTFLRAGLAAALVAFLATAALGMTMALGLVGVLDAPLSRLVDVHVAIAVVGAVVLLLGVVGSVVLPMFQGTKPLSIRMLAAWVVLLSAALLLAVAARLADAIDGDGMAWILAWPVMAFASGVLLLQWQAPHRRNSTLTTFWRWGALALLAGTVVALSANPWPDARRPIVLGVLGLGIALPALMLGMWLEIVAFLGWLDLQRIRSRGLRIPGVDGLLPEKNKARLFVLHAISGVSLLIAATWPNASSAIFAASMLAAAYGFTGYELYAMNLRCRRFAALTLAQSGASPC